jgi:hypothetical protein
MKELAMSKYQPLGKYLSQQDRAYISMTFREIERIVGRNLPPSKAHRAWWSNNPTNNVMTKQWLNAGYETESVDVAAEKLIFRRVDGKADAAGSVGSGGSDVEELYDPIFGCMKGTMTIPADLDLAAPADAEWGKVYEDG